MMPRLEKFVLAARAVKIKVVWIQCAYNTAPNHYLSEVWLEQARRRRNGAYVAFPVCEPGQWNQDFFSVRPLPDEVIVTKHRYGAFENTDLDLVLRSNRNPQRHHHRCRDQRVLRDRSAASVHEGLLRAVHQRLQRHLFPGPARRHAVQHRPVLRPGRDQRGDHGVLAGCRAAGFGRCRKASQFARSQSRRPDRRATKSHSRAAVTLVASPSVPRK